MTNDEHRELDARIDKIIFGLESTTDTCGKLKRVDFSQNYEVPHYSTDMTDAWCVVEAMKERGWAIHLANNPCADKQNAVIFKDGALQLGKRILAAEYEDGEETVAEAIPLTICKAALEAVKQ